MYKRICKSCSKKFGVVSNSKKRGFYCSQKCYGISKKGYTPWNKGTPAMFNPEKIKLPPFYVDTKFTRQQFCKYLAEINFMDNEF